MDATLEKWIQEEKRLKEIVKAIKEVREILKEANKKGGENNG